MTSENTPVVPVVQSNLSTIDYRNPEVIATLKATVAAGLNDAEFLLFVEHCKGTGLNPFKREVWAIKSKSYTNRDGRHVEGKLQLMTGLNGFYAIANKHPAYDGIETGLVGPNGKYLTQAYPKTDFIGAWAKVYIKGRRVPVEAVAMLDEYDKSRTDSRYGDSGIWRTMKRVMITKCAESLALRKAFPQELNGMYTAEEMPPEYASPQATTATAVEVSTREVVDAKPVHYADKWPIPPAQSGPIGGGPIGGPIDWGSFRYRYHLPTKKEGKDMDAVRAWLKKHGFKFNPGDRHWYGNLYVEKIAKYIRNADDKSPEPEEKDEKSSEAEAKYPELLELPFSVEDDNMPNI